VKREFQSQLITSILKMCHLILDSSTNVQKTAYQFLQGAARKRTEHLVIEAGVDTEGTVKADLPVEILDILQRTISSGETAEPGQEGQVRTTWIIFRSSLLTGIAEHLWASAWLDASV
jgi:hypothetical protein